MTAYAEFLEKKTIRQSAVGIDVDPNRINSNLFDFQRDFVRWACRKGRCAIFADTGLGKASMQVEIARLIDKPALLLAPLSVAKQTIWEAKKILNYEDISYSNDGKRKAALTITNYEHAHKFNEDEFETIVIDESSILKGLDGKTRKLLTNKFRNVTYRFCCTATPAPNDIAEIANHAEFLGIMSREDMLSCFFVHRHGSNGSVGGWDLKGHAREPFYRWLASWSMAIKKPSDLGYSDDGFILPRLEIMPHFVETDWRPDGELFAIQLQGITQRSEVRRETLEERVSFASDLVNRAPDDQWIVWCGRNDESAEMTKRISGAVEVKGSDSVDHKIDSIERFVIGDIRVLVTKPAIFGFGMNLQNCHRMVFVGLSDSFEIYYQAIRRCYRFGQKHPVVVDIVLSEAESVIYHNVKRKEAEAKKMTEELIKNAAQYEREEISGMNESRFEYSEDTVEQPGVYKLMLGDSVERIKEIDDESVGVSVYSPPFMSLYAYSDTERDMGNSKSSEDFWKHYSFITNEILRVTLPGRHTLVHCQQIPATNVRDGYIGMRDFRGDLIRHYIEHGWIYHGEVCLDKCPQAQAIRTKAKGLMFVQKDKDSSWLRPGLADYILVFRKPGENPVPINCDVTNEEWIQWAHPVWYGINETEVLKPAEGRDEKDERHIAPLQLETIHRCLRLWSNQGELVFSPFMGIGSEGYVAMELNRRFIGIELKPSYFKAACNNIRSMYDNQERQLDLFEGVV